MAILGGAPSRLEQITRLQAPDTGSAIVQASGPFPSDSVVPRPSNGVAAASFIPAPLKASYTTEAASAGMASSYKPRSGYQSRAGSDTSQTPDLFGTVAVPVASSPFGQRWQRVSTARLDVTGQPWAEVAHIRSGETKASYIERVNHWVNRRISYVDDLEQYGQSDRWASAAESLARGKGDCEDYAIAKMQLLRAGGIPTRDLFLVIARDLVRRADHAVLIARVDGHLLVLDNNTDVIVEADSVQDYRPILTYSDSRSWTHGYRVAPEQQVAAGPIAALP